MNLIDQYLAFGHKSVQSRIKPKRNLLIEARRFVLNKEASEFVADLTKKAVVEILSQHQFARAPYDVTWVELDQKAYFQHLHGNETDPTADENVGYLIDNNTVWICSKDGTNHPAILPYQFHLHSPISFDDELSITQEFSLSRLDYRQTVVGFETRENDELIRDVAMSHRIQLIKEGYEHVPAEQWGRMLKSGTGELRKIITLLLLLTRPSKFGVNFENVGRSSGISRGKRVTFMSHNKVKMKLTKEKAVKKVIKTFITDIIRRRHDVRGHWCQTRNDKTRNCDHVWQPMDENKYVCQKCHGRRWWRKNHERGSCEKGLVVKEYDVTP